MYSLSIQEGLTTRIPTTARMLRQTHTLGHTQTHQPSHTRICTQAYTHTHTHTHLIAQLFFVRKQNCEKTITLITVQTTDYQDNESFVL